MLLLEASYYDLEPYISDMKKSGLCFGKNTLIFKIVEDDTLVGFTGVIFWSKKARFKNSYIFPQFRRKGLYDKSKKMMIEFVKERGVLKVEAIATKMSAPWFVKNNFSIIKQYKQFTHFERKI